MSNSAQDTRTFSEVLDSLRAMNVAKLDAVIADVDRCIVTQDKLDDLDRRWFANVERPIGEPSAFKSRGSYAASRRNLAKSQEKVECAIDDHFFGRAYCAGTATLKACSLTDDEYGELRAIVECSGYGVELRDALVELRDNARAF